VFPHGGLEANDTLSSDFLVRFIAFQGREFFILLAERGKTVRMVTYPGSPHFPTLAEQRRDIMTELKNWLTHYKP